MITQFLRRTLLQRPAAQDSGPPGSCGAGLKGGASVPRRLPELRGAWLYRSSSISRRSRLISAAVSSSWCPRTRWRAADTWLQRLSRVREGAGKFHTVRTYAETVNAVTTDLVVAQFPYRSEQPERWVALQQRQDGADAAGSRLSLVLVDPPADFSQPIAGILVDEWPEVIPRETETTGLTFHFDAPDARPPQSILLAVSADEAPTWTPEALYATLDEALDLVKVRSVDPDILQGRPEGLSQIFPAAYFALNVAGDTASTDFTAVAKQTLRRSLNR